MKTDPQKIYVLIRVWNGYSYLMKCLTSVFNQKHTSSLVVVCMDDCSDYTQAEQKNLRKLLARHIYVRNSSRKFSVHNAYLAHKHYIPDDAVVVNLDGDDWLAHENVIKHINHLYQDPHCWMTYGGCEYFLGKKSSSDSSLPLSSKAPQRYPLEVEQNAGYRSEFFLPIHLRTWRAALFKMIKQSDLLREDGSWLKFCEDQAFYFPMLEMAGGKYVVTTEPLYSYNLETSLSDHELYRKEKFLDELRIRKKMPYPKLKCL